MSDMIEKEYYEKLEKNIYFKNGLPYWKERPFASHVDIKKPAGKVKSRGGHREIGVTINGKTKTILAHRLHWFMVYRKLPAMLDHINRIPDDNRIENLRPATRSQNTRNTIPRGLSKYMGVSWVKGRNKWSAECKINGKKHFLGHYLCEIEAAKAYDKFCIENNLTFANLNFPNKIGDPDQQHVMGMPKKECW